MPTAQIVALCSLFPVLLTASAPAKGGDSVSGPPNVLVVLTDDQPYRSSLARMEAVNALEAVRFANAYTNNPLCCPSRATMLTGLYDHHTRVTSNYTGHRLDESSTIATWFNEAGYRTGLFGKYLNGYPFGRSFGYVPPGWDEWHVFAEETGYYDYELSENGTPVSYGSDAEDYSTDVLAGKLEGFIASSQAPFFAVLSPHAPHLPAVPAPRHAGMYSDENVRLAPNFDRVGRFPPDWISRRSQVDPTPVKNDIRSQWETLEAVDEAVGTAVDRLDEIGELDETILVFMSDNGLSHGSHRWLRKTCGYDECIHVPLSIAAPGIEGHAEDALVSNVDLAPTVADLAGVETPEVDGESLGPIMQGDSSSLHRPILLHNRYDSPLGHPNAPTYRGIRTHRWKLIAYKNGENELYNVRRDPFELKNLATQPRMRWRRRVLEERIEELRG